MRKILSFCILFLVTLTAQATPVRWELNDIQFVDVGVNLNPVTGSFIYDADTQAVSNVSFSGIPTLGIGSDFSLLYGFDLSGDGSSIVFTESAVASTSELKAYSGAAMLLGFTSRLTNSGGVTTLLEGIGPGPLLDNASNSAFCSDGIDSCLALGIYNVTSYESLGYAGGTIVGSAVPVPATAWLLGSALAGLGWVRRKSLSNH